MFIMDQAFDFTEDEALMLIQEAVHDTENNEFRSAIIDPVIKVLESSKGKKAYIQAGSEFLDSNAEMLAKPFPTKSVSYPHKYVDSIFELFGYDKAEFKKLLRHLLESYKKGQSFNVVMNGQTNIFHTIALFYSDMIYDRKLRDSARQQLGLTMYGHIFSRYFKKGSVDERAMEYTHSQLSGSWDIVKAENMINWIGSSVEVAYGSYRSLLSVEMSTEVMVKFIGRVWTTFNQKMHLLANKYYANKDNRDIGGDVVGDEEYLDTKDYAKIRDNVLRMIISGDPMYKTKSSLYKQMAKYKNVKCDDLYDFAQKIEKKDIKTVIDTILYVFLVKEGHKAEEISSTEYIRRITNFPTAIDRAIQGKPVIAPLAKKYEADANIVKAYICLIATFIMARINEARPS